MATGALDANGIWQYGEDDNLSPWSGPGGYMNKGQAATSNAITGPSWTYPTLLGSWVQFDATETTFAKAKHKKRLNRVTVSGMVKSGAVGTAPGIFVLPVGSRPLKTILFITPANAGIADLRVTPTGIVYVSSYYAGGTNANVSLDFSFEAEQ